MQVLSPVERQMIGGGAGPCRCPAPAASQTEMPLPAMAHHASARIFADTVAAGELWPA
ncbi:hypothetical protein [Herbaspirillum sp. alder98]|uniref:hypothetical protein n=1 Tax=Herbaspirillum sp. alder98 TaxID=2913096 RepID=UPI001CD87AE6|nr:hypothetical protein [Herbaspirillum sp. alder98]MCA1323961.1 hypothetical protein [Herbaspirillum sp. alder98]